MVHNSQEEKPKKKRKVSSKHSKVVDELDKISRLPRTVVDNILSHLPIRDVVRTSVLSRKWRYKWVTIPSLEFDNKCCTASSQRADTVKKLVGIIYHVLLFHQGGIQKFKISHKMFEGVADFDRWIVHISGSSIEEFILELWKGERYKLPSYLFNCQNLTRLELLNCSFKPPPAFKGFENLKIFHLEETVINQDVFEDLIRACPLLEKLTLIDIEGFTNLNIDAPNLKYIYAWSVFHDVSFKNTSNLASVKIGFEEKVEHIHHEPTADESSSKLLVFFDNLPHIQRLKFHGHFLKYVACGSIPSSFPNKCLDLNYFYININFNDLDETQAALCVLQSSPNLQELEINSMAEEQPDARTYYNFWKDNLESSLFTHLQVATMENVSGFGPELDFLCFLLSKARVLKKMTVKPVSGDVSMELVKELLRFKRACSDLEVIYLDPDA